MRILRGALVLAWLLSSLTAPAFSHQPAYARGECDGLDAYRADLSEFFVALGDAADGLGFEDNAEFTDLTANDFTTMADLIHEILDDLERIDAPDILAAWHAKKIEELGLTEMTLRAIAEGGLFAAFIYIDPMTELDAELDVLERAAIAACPGAAVVILEFDEGAPDDDPVILPATSSIIAPRQTAQTNDDWSVRVDAAFADPATIDASATWFNDWLDDNPRPDGKEFLTVRVTATNDSDEPFDLLDFPYGFVSPDGDVYDYHDTCGSVPGEWSYQTVVDPGSTVSGNLCLVVPVEDLSTLVFFVGDPTGDAIFFSIGR